MPNEDQSRRQEEKQKSEVEKAKTEQIEPKQSQEKLDPHGSATEQRNPNHAEPSDKKGEQEKAKSPNKNENMGTVSQAQRKRYRGKRGKNPNWKARENQSAKQTRNPYKKVLEDLNPTYNHKTSLQSKNKVPVEKSEKAKPNAKNEIASKAKQSLTNASNATQSEPGDEREAEQYAIDTIQESAEKGYHEVKEVVQRVKSKIKETDEASIPHWTPAQNYRRDGEVVPLKEKNVELKQDQKNAIKSKSSITETSRARPEEIMRPRTAQVKRHRTQVAQNRDRLKTYELENGILEKNSIGTNSELELKTISKNQTDINRNQAALKTRVKTLRKKESLKAASRNSQVSQQNRENKIHTSSEVNLENTNASNVSFAQMNQKQSHIHKLHENSERTSTEKGFKIDNTSESYSPLKNKFDEPNARIRSGQDTSLKTRREDAGLKTRKYIESQPTNSVSKTGASIKKAENHIKTAKNGIKTAETAAKMGANAAKAGAGAASGGVALAIESAIKAKDKIKEIIEKSSNNEAKETDKKHGILGGVVAVLMVPILMIVFILSGNESSPGSGSNVNLSDEVIAYMPLIKQACDKYGISEYTNVVAAMMMQESGGRTAAVKGDVMQCAEAMGFPAGTPVEPKESIDFGVKYFAGCVILANPSGAGDITGINLSLQGYNFGNGYISWAKKNHGGYSKENAIAFSNMMAAQMGWGGYGDVEYPEHVMRYYQVGEFGEIGDIGLIGDGRFAYPMPGFQWSTYGGHWGIDINGSGILGKPIMASADGVVVYAKNGWQPNDGTGGNNSYGNAVFLKHAEPYQSRYAHMTQTIVSVNEQVKQGQVIGYVGSTGNSSGPHLHFEIVINGSATGNDGRPYSEHAFPQYRR